MLEASTQTDFVYENSKCQKGYDATVTKQTGKFNNGLSLLKDNFSLDALYGIQLYNCSFFRGIHSDHYKALGQHTQKGFAEEEDTFSRKRSRQFEKRTRKRNIFGRCNTVLREKLSCSVL